LLPGCCEEGSNLAKGFGPLEGSEPSRDFLFYLHHAHILLGLIVGKRHVRVCQKTQNGFLQILEAQDVLGIFLEAHEIGLPMAERWMAEERSWAIMNGNAIGDSGCGSCLGLTHPPFGLGADEELPPFFGFLRSPVNPGINGFMRDIPQMHPVCFEGACDDFWGPSVVAETIENKFPKERDLVQPTSSVFALYSQVLRGVWPIISWRRFMPPELP